MKTVQEKYMSYGNLRRGGGDLAQGLVLYGEIKRLKWMKRVWGGKKKEEKGGGRDLDQSRWNQIGSIWKVCVIPYSHMEPATPTDEKSHMKRKLRRLSFRPTVENHLHVGKSSDLLLLIGMRFDSRIARGDSARERKGGICLHVLMHGCKKSRSSGEGGKVCGAVLWKISLKIKLSHVKNLLVDIQSSKVYSVEVIGKNV